MSTALACPEDEKRGQHPTRAQVVGNVNLDQNQLEPAVIRKSGSMADELMVPCGPCQLGKVQQDPFSVTTMTNEIVKNSKSETIDLANLKPGMTTPFQGFVLKTHCGKLMFGFTDKAATLKFRQHSLTCDTCNGK